MHALTLALRDVFGIDGTLADIDFAGRTDRWIIREAFRKYQLPQTEENFNRLFEGYVSGLPAAMQDRHAHVLPGIPELITAPNLQEHFAHGLLTGNMRRGAQVKLSHHGLWQHFPFGAFADDSEQRNDLGPHALRRAIEHHRVSFRADDVWVIGDTPHDIACGKVIGARTLAVATGSHTTAQLKAHTPTAVLADLSETAAVLKLLGVR